MELFQFAHVVQFLALRRLVGLNDAKLRAWRQFLPYVALSAVVANWSYFANSFFCMQVLKFQLSRPDQYRFADGALVCNIFIQLLFSANFLDAFTAAGLWMHIFMRYDRLSPEDLVPWDSGVS